MKHSIRGLGIAGWLMLSGAVCAAQPSAPAAGELISVSTRAGVTQSMYLSTSTPTPAWVVLLFAGDDGALHLSANGPTTLRGNFLIRTASYWQQKGDAAVLIDTPSDHANGVDDDFRLSADALQDVDAAVGALRQRFPSSRIALVGTSRGTVSVGNALQRNPALADAYVMTSPVSIARNGQPGLSGLSADGTRSHVLVVSNRSDGCAVALFSGAARIAQENHFALIAVESNNGGGRRAECTGRSPHGFLGIEDEVLGDIDGWLGSVGGDASGQRPSP